MFVSAINSISTWISRPADKAPQQPGVWDALGKFLFTGGPTAGLTGCSFIVDKYGPKESMDGGTDTETDTGTDTDVPDSGTDADPDGGLVCENAPDAFSLLAPADDTINVSLSPTLDWEDSPDPDPDDLVSYRLEIDTVDTFDSPEVYNDIDPSQFSIPMTLDNGQTYYWRVYANDLCEPANETVSDEVFSFTTIEECSTPPGAFSLLAPADSSGSVSTTPTFDWQDSLDPDTLDTVTYTLQIDTVDTFPSPDEFADLASSTYSLGLADELLPSTTYYWKVVARDGCTNEVESTETYSFTTAASCTPHTYDETDFLTGTPTDVVVDTGNVLLTEDSTAWTYQYDGSLFPEIAGWTENAPSGWTVKENDPPGIFHASSIGIDATAQYERDCGFDSTTGWIVDSILQAGSVETGSSDIPLGFFIADGINYTRIRILSNMIEALGGTSTPWGTYSGIMPSAGYFHIRITGRNNDVMVYVNDMGIPAIDGTGQLTDTMPLSFVYFNDAAGVEDSEAWWDHIYCYNAGDTLPFTPTGTFLSDVIDTGTASNDLGSGAVISWTALTPADSALSLAIRAGATSDLSSETWSSELTSSPGIIPSTAVGRYFQWRATFAASSDQAETPLLMDVHVNYETCD
ncbi:hypothetical protein ACFL1W_01980 [Candidatus Margulisiibacteriota bacterium]